MTVMETLSCWVPGEIGTEDARDAAGPAAGKGKGCAGAWSVMLMTGPRCRPRAVAYWVALTLALVTAAVLARASRVLVSVRFREIPLMVVALPPARVAALIWVPAALRRRRVAVSDSLAP